MLAAFVLVGALAPAYPAIARPHGGEVEPWGSGVGSAAAVSVGRSLLVGDLNATVKVKAQPDECFNGSGRPYPPGPPCDEGQPKVNQLYAWGLAKIGSLIWIGTGANVHCLVGGVFLGTSRRAGAGDETVCEGKKSQRAKTPGFPGKIGDSRPPDAFSYNTSTGELIDRTLDEQRFDLTIGLRAAGAHNNVVLLAGPAIELSRGINIFAFRADNGTYLGSRRLDQYNDIRSFVIVNGVAYTGVLNESGGGSVLRWNGSVSNPFDFELVGRIDNEVAYLAEHEGRLFVTTWSILTQTAGRCPNSGCPVAGLWMSPALPGSGLTQNNANQWQKVWDVNDYEPDEVIARSYGGGALQSFDGWLYWGTLHVPGLAGAAFKDEYGGGFFGFGGGGNSDNTERAGAVFRGRSFATNPELQVAYGETSLPAFTPGQGWQNEPTGMGPPLYGGSGFDNENNQYIWTMAVFGGRLYVGTFKPPFSDTDRGGDLWRFPSSAVAAQAVSRNGIGNPFNWGIRTMIADDKLYLGMAGRANLRTDPPDGSPAGGWELIEVTPQ